MNSNDNERVRRFERPENRRRRLLKKQQENMTVIDWVQCVCFSLTFGILLFIFILRPVRVDGHSMLQTLQHNDRLFISNLFYEPKQGDIVVLQKDEFAPEAIVKRVIATEGQTVSIDFEKGVVSVDGVELDEPYTNTPTNLQEDFSQPVTVPAGHIFVMGDNRNGSTDSRDSRIGCVDTRCVIGRALILMVPGVGEDGRIDISRLFTLFV